MADEERKQIHTQNRPNQEVRAEILQEIDPSELGYLRPSATPSNQERQGWDRGRAMGLGEGREQAAQSRHPELSFADTGTQDLSASARESAVHMKQNELGSFGDRDVLSERQQAEEQQQSNAPERHRQQREQDASQEIEQEQQKEQSRER